MAAEASGGGAQPWELPPVELYSDEPTLAQIVPIKRNGKAPTKPTTTNTASVTLQDFIAYMPTHQYVCMETRELWPAASVNSRIAPVETEDGATTKASEWLDKHQAAEQMTWAPGEEPIIKDRLVSNGGWKKRKGMNCINLYVPPTPMPGDATKATPWLDHVARIYPDDVDHIVKWWAQRVQQPGVKPNHALVLGGGQGIGKDTALEPVKAAVGPWNLNEVSPIQLLGRFNSFIKSTVLRISEGRDLGEVDRYAFYEHMKVYTAAPPDVLRCDEKNLREHAVINVCGVIITTNHKTDGIYLPADDRRHYVAWSAITKEDFTADYFRELYSWYAAGGLGHVAAYLAKLDLSNFDPKAPPPKTAAFWDIVDANRAPEDAALADIVDLLGNPTALTLNDLQHPKADSDFRSWLQDPRNRRAIPHRLESVGYVAVRNDAAKDGLWVINGKRQVIYAIKDKSVRDKIAAANQLLRDASR